MFVSDVSDFKFVGKVKPAFLLQRRKYFLVRPYPSYMEVTVGYEVVLHHIVG